MVRFSCPDILTPSGPALTVAPDTAVVVGEDIAGDVVVTKTDVVLGVGACDVGLGVGWSVDTTWFVGGTAPAMAPQKSETGPVVSGKEELQSGDVIQGDIPVTMLAKPSTTTTACTFVKCIATASVTCA